MFLFFVLFLFFFVIGIFRLIMEFIEEYLNKVFIVKFILKMFYFNGKSCFIVLDLFLEMVV